VICCDPPKFHVNVHPLIAVEPVFAIVIAA
jgi:hypothetical protein